MSSSTEPAIKSYFFDKGYRDLGQTIADSWRRNLDSAKDHFDRVEKHMASDEKHWAVVWGTAGVSVVLFGSVIFLLASAVHIVVLALFFLLIYLGFSLVYLTERGYLAGKRFVSVCPSCHSKRPLPEYFCPGCNAVHARLIPSSYGILFHTCRCGHRLPATFFLKRGELAARCPDCQQLLDRLHTESRKAFVPIFGGPSVGKSAYLFAAVREFLDETVPELGLTASFLDASTEGDFNRVQQGFARGRTPDKTTAKLPRAINLRLAPPGGSPWVLYLYDPAGEAFDGREDLVEHKYQGYLSGLVFLIDPFSIPAVAADYRDRLPAVEGQLKPSLLPVEDVLSRIVINLEEHFELDKKARVKVPVAVVIGKVDAFDLEGRIGETALAARLKASPTTADPVSTRDQLIREQLVAWEMGDFVQQLESRFSRVRYFTCSSLGRMPDETGRSFQPRQVLDPLMWILGSTDRVFVKRLGRVAA
jgi:hypothetical protein